MAFLTFVESEGSMKYKVRILNLFDKRGIIIFNIFSSQLKNSFATHYPQTIIFKYFVLEIQY